MPQLKPQLASAGPAGRVVAAGPLGQLGQLAFVYSRQVIHRSTCRHRFDDRSKTERCLVERVNKRKLKWMKWKPLIIPGRHETKEITIHLRWRAPPAGWKTLWVPHQTLLLCRRFLGIHVSFCTSKCTLLLDGAPSYCVGREFRHSLQMMPCSWRQQAPLFFKHAKCFVKLLCFANPCQTRSECCFSWVPKPYTLQEAFANAYVWPSPSQDRKGALVL